MRYRRANVTEACFLVTKLPIGNPNLGSSSFENNRKLELPIP